MKYFNWGFIFCTLSLAFIVACKNEGIVDTSSIATDSLSIAQGKRLFTQQCAACHSFSQEGIGPPLVA
ncbi:MAG: cytochrome c [Saprospiraceae bacterium]|nr:cytochrome c [Saprospiraceae bacterium]